MKEGVYYNEKRDELGLVFREEGHLYLNTIEGTFCLDKILLCDRDLVYLGPLEEPEEEVTQPKEKVRKPRKKVIKIEEEEEDKGEFEEEESFGDVSNEEVEQILKQENIVRD